jgi:hypothetical protein
MGETHAPFSDLSAADLVILADNRREAGMALGGLIAMVEAHRRDTNCRQWGCWGKNFAGALGGYAGHQLTQILVCAIERLAGPESEVEDHA